MIIYALSNLLFVSHVSSLPLPFSSLVHSIGQIAFNDELKSSSNRDYYQPLRLSLFLSEKTSNESYFWNKNLNILKVLKRYFQITIGKSMKFWWNSDENTVNKLPKYR